MYSVVTSSFRGAGAGGHFDIGAKISRKDMSNRIITQDNTLIRELIRHTFIQQGEVKPFSFNNWKFIPENYVTPAKAREFEELINR